MTWRTAVALMVIGFVTCAITVLTLRAPRCVDTWTIGKPGDSGECSSTGYIAEHPEVKGSDGAVLIVCRCRPEPRMYAPESHSE